MQYALLEEKILENPEVSQRDLTKRIKEYPMGTVGLLTSSDPPHFKPVDGPWAPSYSAQFDQFKKKELEQHPITPPEPMGLSIKPNSTKLFGPEIGSPFMRIDRKSHDGLPENHLQYGFGEYTGRHGNEAYEILTDVFTKSKRNILFPFDEKKKEPWEY